MPDVFYSDDFVTIYHGDCREILPEVEADLLVSSPPYLSQRDYGQGFGSWDDLVPPAIAAARCDQILVNLGLVHIDGAVVPYWNSLNEAMEASGKRLFGWYVWDQGSGLPGDWNGRLAPSHEFIFHFNATASKTVKWVKTKTSDRTHSGGGLRHKDGHINRSNHNGRQVQDTKVADSVVRVTREMRRDLNHPARYPLTFASHMIRSFEGGTVLDPFMGSGTTLRAAKDLGRKSIGIELEERYCEIAAQRCAQDVLDLGAAA